MRFLGEVAESLHTVHRGPMNRDQALETGTGKPVRLQWICQGTVIGEASVGRATSGDHRLQP